MHQIFLKFSVNVPAMVLCSQPRKFSFHFKIVLNLFFFSLKKIHFTDTSSCSAYCCHFVTFFFLFLSSFQKKTFTKHWLFVLPPGATTDHNGWFLENGLGAKISSRRHGYFGHGGWQSEVSSVLAWIDGTSFESVQQVYTWAFKEYVQWKVGLERSSNLSVIYPSIPYRSFS